MKKKKLLVGLLAVLLVTAIIAGGTFAFFQWTSGDDQITSVNVTIEAGQITMHIEPTKTVYTNLRPTNSCNNAVAYGDALATIVNNTGAMAIPSFKLSVKVTKNEKGTLTTDDLSHIHYAVVPIDTNESGVKGDVVEDCENPVSFSLANSNLYFNGITSGVATGVLTAVATNGEWSDIPAVATEYLPRQFNTSSVEAYGVTFLGKPHTTSYQWFRVYVWIDDEYTFTNTGEEITDPLQDAKIEITWSSNSMVEQVSSIVSGDSEEVENGIAPGFYDMSGNLVSSWDELISSESINVSGTKLVSTDNMLYGELVIPNEITIIGSNALLGSSLQKITFNDNSQLETIEGGAFSDSSLSSLEIPITVKSIGDYVLYNNGRIVEVTYKGTKTEWNNITLDPDWYVESAVEKVICSDGEITV